MSTARRPHEASSRVAAIDWSAVSADLDAQGWAVMPKLLSAKECDAVAGRYDTDDDFRSHVIMARHGFGRGEYKYFAYPLPPLVEELRTDLYRTSRRSPIAGTRRWGWTSAFPTIMHNSSRAATRRDRLVRRRCCSNTARTITTRFTRISMASMSSRFRSRPCSASRARISRAASSSSLSSVSAHAVARDGGAA